MTYRSARQLSAKGKLSEDSRALQQTTLLISDLLDDLKYSSLATKLREAADSDEYGHEAQTPAARLFTVVLRDLGFNRVAALYQELRDTVEEAHHAVEEAEAKDAFEEEFQ